MSLHFHPSQIHEIVIGLFSLTIGNFLSAVVACWILNGGYTTMYYGMGDRGYLWFFLQWPVIFIYQVQRTYTRSRSRSSEFGTVQRGK